MKESRKTKKKTARPEETVLPAPDLLARFRAYADGAQGRWLIPVLVVFATLLVGSWTFDSKLSLSGDNAEFITLARSLVQGEGLTHINSPDPQPATKYPFGFPLLLAPMELFFPGEWTPMKAWVLVLFSLGMGALYMLVRDKAGTLPALAVVALSLTAGQSYLTTGPEGHLFGPLLLHFSHQVMSEAPFLAVSLVALLLLERGMAREGLFDNRYLVGGFACAMLSYYIRSVGIALVGAAIIYLLLRRDFRRGLVFAAASFVVWLPWTLRNRAVGSGGVYLEQLIQVNPYYPDQGLLDFSGVIARLIGNGATYLNYELPRLLWPYFAGGREFGPVAVFVLIVAAYTLYQALRFGRDGLFVLYTMFTLGVALLWFWVDARFLFGAVPLFFYFTARAVIDLANGMAAHRGRWTGHALRWGLFIVVFWGQVPGVARLAEYTKADYPPAWSRYYQAGQWLQENAAEDAVVLCRKGYWMYIVSGRRCVGFPFEGTEAVLAHMEREKVDYVVLESLGFAQTVQYLVPTVNEHRDRFAMMWKDEVVSTYVLKFQQTP
ncbi:MAG: hypothetical protein ACI906_001361 [Candidatus Latescibacterota bacterium]|jgi:hypothetical protein